MPARPPRRCRRPLCPYPATVGGVCEQHRPKFDGAFAAGRRELPADWPERRQAVLARDGHACRLRLPGCTVLANDVHHVGARDDHSVQNLQAVCSHCHRRVSGRQGGTAPHEL
ncbi:MAG: HNH endonuclease [Candidatus Dormibacteraeota bacterium]|nr:HNH endonuclease [Candidatus Dormibacteraeota bacterium]